MSLHLYDPKKVQEYFEALAATEFLALRFCGFKDPTLEDIWLYIRDNATRMYVIIDEDGDIAAELTLDAPSGQVWQLHFSMRPSLSFKCKLTLAKTVVQAVTSWPEVSALYGLTPVKNRAACVFVLKTGFKKVAILPNGTLFQGKPSDAMLSIYGGIL